MEQDDVLLTLIILQECRNKLSLIPAREKEVFLKLQELSGYLTLKYKGTNYVLGSE